VESNSGIILTGKTEVLGEKPVPVPLLPPRIACTTWSKRSGCGKVVAAKGHGEESRKRHGECS
jgi:hypothetical protein